jgi:Protein kinase domain/Domain of unknown function (DUF4440)
VPKAPVAARRRHKLRAVTELTEGAHFAGHRIDGLVGRGGMGVVYRATHLALDRPVALKLITPDLAEEPGFRERFQRESRIAAALDHPHVITVHHAGEEDGLLFITMRLIDGEDLRAVLEREGRLEPRRAARIVGQVAEALDAAHASSLVHRDIKPANVLIAGSGDREHVYLTDFGLTKRDTSIDGLTRTGEIVGTLDYIAPEQIRGESVDARTDVYALGCMLFELVTGDVPFEGDVYAAKVFAHLNTPAPSVTDRVPGAPPTLDEVVRRALEKDPGNRYQSAGELGAAAIAATDAAPATIQQDSVTESDSVAEADAQPAARPAAETIAGAPPRPARSRLRRLAPALVAVAVVAAVVAGLLLGRGSDAEELASGDVRAVLDRYQASLTNGDLGSLEELLAPNFTRQLLADEPVDRDTALRNYRRAFRFRGSAPRYALTNLQVFTGKGSATATGRYEFTGEGKAHLGDYGAVRFELAERDGRVQIERVATWPDVIAFLPGGLRPSHFPLTVSLTATTRADGRTVTIASGTTRLPRAPDAVKLPLNVAGRRVLRSEQRFVARTRITRADGRRLPEQSYTGRFEGTSPQTTGR